MASAKLTRVSLIIFLLHTWVLSILSKQLQWSNPAVGVELRTDTKVRMLKFSFL
jgi:hypothetical protein